MCKALRFDQARLPDHWRYARVHEGTHDRQAEDELEKTLDGAHLYLG
jgi:hypothetical protein